MSDDRFTRDKFRWLDQVATDATISPTAFRLAYILASMFLNRRRGYAFPTQDALGEPLNIRARQVRNLLRELTIRGHLARKRGGNGRASEYRIVLLQTGNVTAGQNGADRQYQCRQTGNRSADQPFDDSIDRRPPAALPSDQSSTVDHCRDARLDGASPHPDPEMDDEDYNDCPF